MPKFWMILLSVLITPLYAAKSVPPASAATLWQAQALNVELRLNRDLLSNLNARLTLSDAADAQTLTLSFADAQIDFAANGDSFARFQDARGSSEQALILSRSDAASKQKSSVSLALRLQVLPAQARALALVDAKGAHWFETDTGQVYVSADRTLLRVTYADLSLGEAAAQFLGDPRLQGIAIGNFSLRARITQKPAATPRAIACGVPKWQGLPIDPLQPNGAKYQTDVKLINVRGWQQMRCDSCDGPGGTDTGRVVVGFDAAVANTDNDNSADVPWHTKFSGLFAPYSNDQHPMLVWNLYRLHRQTGQLQQIGRSAAKHAFATINANCEFYDCGDPQVLYRTCVDEYPAFTNDTADFLAPRSEIVPSRGIWARCASTRDANCDGQDDFPAIANYDQRLVVSEGLLSDRANYRYFYEGWYVVRDDSNVYNSMGFREFEPDYAGLWRELNPSVYQSGPVLDLWVNPSAPGPNALSTEVVLADGKLKLAVRARLQVNGNWRYDYALMNVDYAQAQLQADNGSVANMRMLARSAVSGLKLPLGSGNIASAIQFYDADASLPDWDVLQTAEQLRFNAANLANQLTWGNVYSFSFETAAAPMIGNATVALDNNADVTIASLLPTPSDTLFQSGFE
jgi:hypothetical protein